MESERRDREMPFEVDEHLKSVLEFMQRSIPTCKLVGIAEKMPEMARLLWGHYSQEPVKPLLLASNSNQ
jgi:hypothetical protein